VLCYHFTLFSFQNRGPIIVIIREITTKREKEKRKLDNLMLWLLVWEFSKATAPLIIHPLTPISSFLLSSLLFGTTFLSLINHQLLLLFILLYYCLPNTNSLLLIFLTYFFIFFFFFKPLINTICYVI